MDVEQVLATIDPVSPTEQETLIVGRYRAWADGEIDARTALAGYAADLREMEARAEPLERLRVTVRALCEEIVKQAGEAIAIPGFGEFAFAPAGIVRGYDRKALDALLHDLIAAGEGGWAQRLEGCRAETTRAGGLRITKERGKQ